MSELPAWTRTEIVAVAPEMCPNGHRLRYPNVAISSDVNKISYECLTCSTVVHRGP